MVRLAASLAWSHLRRHPLLAALNVASLAVGVGVFLGVRIANESATEAFSASVDLIAGRSDLEVRSAAGSIPDSLWPSVRRHPSVTAATPVLEGLVTLPDFSGEFLRIAGIDPFTRASFETWKAAPPDRGEDAFALDRWLSEPGTVAMSRPLAAAFGLEIGDRLTARTGGRDVELTLGYFLRWGDDQEDSEATRATAARIAAMDIGWAQELLGKVGELTSIQVQVDDAADLEEAVAALQRIAPPDAIVAPPEARSRQLDLMVRGFQLNLDALSMISVIVGVFLIFATMSAAVVRRRQEIGILRASGGSRAQVTIVFLAEAAALGAAGAALGIPLGTFVAGQLVDDVARTISTHYVLVRIEDLRVEPWTVAAAAGYGAAAAIMGAWFPAREAGRVEPAAALTPARMIDIAPIRLGRFGIVAVAAAVIAAAAGWIAVSKGPAWLSFASCVGVVIACAAIVPAAVTAGCRALGIVARAAGRLAGARMQAALLIVRDDLQRAIPRTSLTTGALAIAVSMAVGVSMMIASFRVSMTEWIERTMRSDLYITSAAAEDIGAVESLPAEMPSWLAARSEVATADTYFRTAATLADGIDYHVVALGGSGRERLDFRGPDAASARAAFLSGNAVAVSESLAEAFDLGRGDLISIPTPSGIWAPAIAGVVTDYSDDHGAVFIRREALTERWSIDDIHSIAVGVHDGAAMGPLIEAARARFGRDGALAFRSNRDLRARISRIFDQTFAVTYVLRAIAVGVAALGITLGLSALVLERSRTIALLRSVGASKGQIAASVLIEASVIGAVSGGVGILCGGALAAVLTYVVNPAFFGWTIHLHLPAGEMAATPLWVLAAAVIASLLPALRAASVSPAPALRHE